MAERPKDSMPTQEKEIDRFLKALKKELSPQLYSLGLICTHYEKNVDLKSQIIEVVDLIREQTAQRFGEEASKSRRYQIADIIEKWKQEVESGYSGTMDEQFHRAFLRWSETMVNSLRRIKNRHQWFDPSPIAKVFLKLKV